MIFFLPSFQIFIQHTRTMLGFKSHCIFSLSHDFSLELLRLTRCLLMFYVNMIFSYIKWGNSVSYWATEIVHAYTLHVLSLDITFYVLHSPEKNPYLYDQYRWSHVNPSHWKTKCDYLELNLELYQSIIADFCQIQN